MAVGNFQFNKYKRVFIGDLLKIMGLGTLIPRDKLTQILKMQSHKTVPSGNIKIIHRTPHWNRS